MDPSSSPPPVIRPIAPAAVRRIAAGQAVTDLSSAVKELVDNAIDAGARRVTVKLHDQGLEAIEVSDDGGGVPPASRPLMATKHATSKLRCFDDLYRDRSRRDEDEGENDLGGAVGGESGAGEKTDTGDASMSCAPTLGFRGEALFCLSHLSRSLAVTTRSACDNNGGLGEQFAFDREGNLIEGSVKKVPRPVGTTVTVRGLFEAVPVRRVDLCKRIKGQRQKVMRTMQGYAILCLGTQFNVTDVHSQNSGKKAKGRGKSEVRLATSEASQSLEARTANVLGTKFLSGLARIEVDLTGAVSQSNTNEGAGGNGGGRWKLMGLVSHAPASPEPPTARDLQFFSVNGRPVDLPSVSRLLGDVWRLFDPTSAETKSSSGGGASSGRKRPACVLAFDLPAGAYDVNLSPDKREVMFADEAAVTEALREGLTALWEGQCGGRFATNEVEGRSNEKAKAGSKEASRAKKDDVDNVTPKLTRKEGGSAVGADDGPVVTPLDAADNSRTPASGVGASAATGPSPNSEEESGRRGKEAPPSVTQEMSQQSNKKAATSQEKRAATSQNRGENTAHQRDDDAMPSQRGWDQRRQLPERARQQDRRGWEQMRINFQRIEKKELREEMERVLPADEEEGDDDGPGEASVFGTSAAWRERMAQRQSSSSRAPASNSEQRVAARNASTSAKRPDKSRQTKRQKRPKRDIASVLDGFSYGSTKPVTAPEDDAGSEGESEESETVEVADLADGSYGRESEAIASRKKRNNARMRVGETASSERKRPRAASRESVEAANRRASRKRSSSLDSSMDEEEDDRERGDKADTVEAVWTNFSGTRDVIQQYRNARLTMKKTRKRVHSSIKRKRNDGGKEALADEETSSDDVAEQDEPTINLKQEDFSHMSIIGQFNLGFILARCRNNSLWILDQHACDEKYNFERLCRETVIHEQKLIAPLPLELSPSEEHTVLENMEVFERNGFRFAYDPEKAPRHRLSLTALPHSGSGGDGKKAVQFGKEDVGALCAMLGADGVSSSEGYNAGFDTGVDGGRIAGVNAVRRYAGMAGGGLSQEGAKSNGVVGSSIVRLPKAIAMFASRACRSSIMIGTALSEKEQANILAKLEQTEVPWNCAHGRPTMSHVRSLAKTLLEDEEAIAAHVAGPTLSVDSEV